MLQEIGEFDTAHCGAIYDTQLDAFCHRLATASADGHVRVWDVRRPEKPALVADLAGHLGAVLQVAWAPPEDRTGPLLASVGEDGRVFFWGPFHANREVWDVVHEENLENYGAVRGLSWAPAALGVGIACASTDGTITTIMHQGLVKAGECELQHKWQRQSFSAHIGQANAVSWASAPAAAKAGSLAGARLASAGDDGVRIWRRDEAHSCWQEEKKEFGIDSKAIVRDVSWKPWDGIIETIAIADGQHVSFWECAEASGSRWQQTARIDLKREVWKIEWADIGGQLLASCGLDVRSAVLLKQQLAGGWDAVEVGAAP